MYENHMNPRVEYVSARVRRKRRKSKKEENMLNKLPKNGFRKSDAKVEENPPKRYQKRRVKWRKIEKKRSEN